MATEKSPAFSFYAKDFMLGTVTMSLAERGAYITLLAYQWDMGGVPGDYDTLARILGCTRGQAVRVWLAIVHKFQERPDGWRNARLEVERTKQAERRAALVANGKLGGRPPNKPTETKRFSESKANGKLDETKRFSETKANGNQNESLPSPSPSPSPEEERTKPNTPASPERPPTSQLSKEPADDGNYRVILKLAHEVIETTAILDPTDGDLVEALKASCARNGIDYSAHRVIPKALEAAAKVRLLIPVNGSQPRRSVATMAAELRTAKTPEEMGARLKALAEKKGRS